MNKAAADALWRLALRIGSRLFSCYRFVFRPTVHSVFVAVWHGDRLLVIRNSYKNFKTIPCGLLRRREDPSACAVRELREEVGIDVGADQLHLADDFVSRSGYKSDHARIFELICPDRPTIQLDGREVVWSAFEDVPTVLGTDRLSTVVREYLKRRMPTAPAQGA